MDHWEPLGDRRTDARFEIVGDLWATLVTTQSMALLNLTTGGMLIESPSFVSVGSRHDLRLTLGDRVHDVVATVRHVTPVARKPECYLVGLAFMRLPAEVERQIDTFCGAFRGNDADQGA